MVPTVASRGGDAVGRTMTYSRISSLLVSLMLTSTGLAQTGVMQVLPLPAGTNSPVGATALSTDGSAVAIVGTAPTPQWVARVQRIGGTGVDLGSLSLSPFTDTGFIGPLSVDGSTAFGGPVNLANPGAVRPWRWTASGGRVELPLPAGWTTPIANGLAGDGAFIVGSIVPPSVSGSRACRWVGSGPPELLAPVPSALNSVAKFVARDGTIFGTANVALSRVAFVRWTNGGATADIMADVGQSPFANWYMDVSRNGRVFVGERTTALTLTGRRAILSYNAAEPEELPTPPGFEGSSAFGISPDGRFVNVMGYRTPSGGQSSTVGFVWSRARGLHTYNEFLAQRGVDLAGWDVLSLSLRADSGRRFSGVARLNNVPVAYYVDTEPYSCSGADLDDGSGTGHPDRTHTIDDLVYFLRVWERGDLAADMDDGTRIGDGNPDGAVNVDDLLWFLYLWESDC